MVEVEVRKWFLENLPVVEGKPLIVVGIPAFNEEKTIGKMILKAQKHAHKVIVCDDGSTDMTSEIADRLGAIIVRHEKNLGKGVALRSLFECGRKIDADIFVTLDGDDQHDPNEIPKIVEPILGGEADLVIGCRFSKDNHIPKHRALANRVLNFLTNLYVGKCMDTQSGFRAYSRNALNVIDVTADGLGVDSQILIDAKEKNVKVFEVPVSTQYPKDVKTSKKNLLKHGSEVILSLIDMVSERRPLLFLGVPGLTFFTVGGAFLVIVLGTFNVTRQFAIGTAMLGIASTLIGTLLLFGAFILHVIDKRLRRLEKRITNHHL